MSDFATGGFITGQGGTENLGRCFDIGERMIKHTGELYELQAAETAGHVHWVRINTDDQAAEAVRNVRDRLRQINEGDA